MEDTPEDVLGVCGLGQTLGQMVGGKSGMAG